MSPGINCNYSDLTTILFFFLQDTFLPFVENGTITLIGATTENPSFHLNNALMSRCRVFVLEKLSSEALQEILLRAVREIGLAVDDEHSSLGSDGHGYVILYLAIMLINDNLGKNQL